MWGLELIVCFFGGGFCCDNGNCNWSLEFVYGYFVSWDDLGGEVIVSEYVWNYCGGEFEFGFGGISEFGWSGVGVSDYCEEVSFLE